MPDSAHRVRAMSVTVVQRARTASTAAAGAADRASAHTKARVSRAGTSPGSQVRSPGAVVVPIRTARSLRSASLSGAARPVSWSRSSAASARRSVRPAATLIRSGEPGSGLKREVVTWRNGSSASIRRWQMGQAE